MNRCATPKYLIAAAFALSVGNLHAATFTVTSDGDDSHATNDAVTCSAGSATCTLREAMLEANADGWGNGNSEVIQFALPSGQVVLTNYFLPVVFVNLVVEGRDINSGRNTTIHGNNRWRIFLLGDDGTALPLDGSQPRRIGVQLRHVRLRGAVAKGGDGVDSGGGGAGLGGAVFVNSHADVTLVDVDLKLNAAVGGAGGAITMGTCGGGGGMGGNGGSCTGIGNPFGSGMGGGGGLGGNGGRSNGWLAFGGGGGGIGGDGGDGASSDAVPNNNTNLGGGGGGFSGYLWFAALAGPAGDGADNPGSAGANAGGGGAAGLGSGYGVTGTLIGGGGTASIFTGSVNVSGGGGGFGGQNGSAGGNGGIGGGGGGLSGAGGFGGGGGGGYNGGVGGFGGGGGAGNPDMNNGGFGGGGAGNAGNGGFGGGGAGSGGHGGFGGGNASSFSNNGATGGGGAGFGGAIFVRQGGTLRLGYTEVNTAFAGNVALPGVAGDVNAQLGQGAGSDLYIDSGLQAQFDIAQGLTLTSLGTVSGRGGIVIEGGGRLVLANAGEFEAAATISDGILQTTNGIVAASIIKSNGTLTGAGKIGAVTSAGTLAPGAIVGIGGGFEIHGNLVLQDEPLTCFLADSAGNATSLNVTGNVALGGTAFIHFSGGPAPGAYYTLISSSEPLVGRFDSIQSNIPIQATIFYSAHNVQLVVDESDTIFHDGFDATTAAMPCSIAYGY